MVSGEIGRGEERRGMERRTVLTVFELGDLALNEAY